MWQQWCNGERGTHACCEVVISGTHAVAPMRGTHAVAPMMMSRHLTKDNYSQLDGACFTCVLTCSRFIVKMDPRVDGNTRVLRKQPEKR